MTYWVFVVLDILLLFFAVNSVKKKNKVDILLAEAGAAFVCVYIIVSGILWLVDSFSVGVTLFFVTMISLASFGIAYIKSNVKGALFFLIEEYVIDGKWIASRIVVLLCFFVSLGCFQSFQIEGKDGAAMVMAVSYNNGNTSRNSVVEEYSEIDIGSEYESFFVNSITGLDSESFVDRCAFAEVETEEGMAKKMSVGYGNNPVYPSLLALGIKLFGVDGMTKIQAVIFLFTILLMDAILEHFGCGQISRTLIELLLGFSPLVVYCNKSAVPENIIGLFIVGFLYYLICREGKMQILSTLSVVAFSFLHISFFTILPVFLLAYLWCYLHNGYYRYSISAIITLIGFNLGFANMWVNSRTYTLGAYKFLLGGHSERIIPLVILLLSLAAIIGVVTITLICSKKRFEVITSFFNIYEQKVIKISFLAGTIGVLLWLTYRIVHNKEVYEVAIMNSLVAFAMISGGVLLFVLWCFISQRYEYNFDISLVLLIFGWTVLVYSMAIRPMISSYYYEARYLSSFIPVILILFGIFVKDFRDESVFLPLIAVILVAFPYTTSMLEDDSGRGVEWTEIKDVVNEINTNADENTIVLVDSELLKYYYIPLHEMTNSRIFPFDISYRQDICDALADYNSKALYVTKTYNSEDTLKNPSLVFKNVFQQSSYVDSEKSPISNFLSGYQLKNRDQVNIFSFGSILDMVNPTDYEVYTMEDVFFDVVSVNVVDDKAVICVSITNDADKILYNGKNLEISYHISTNKKTKNFYDNPRKSIGSFVLPEVIEFAIPLESFMSEVVNVTIDIVEDGVEWYSWNHRDCPTFMFRKTSKGWSLVY